MGKPNQDPSDGWQVRARSKSKQWPWLILIILIIGMIWVRNYQYPDEMNLSKRQLLHLSDSLFNKLKPIEPDSGQKQPASQSSDLQLVRENFGSAKQTSQPGMIKKKTEPGWKKWNSGKLASPLRSHPLLYVVVELNVWYSEPEIGEELQFRSEHIKAIIRNVLYTSKPEERTAPILRERIIDSIESILPEGQVKDVVFTDFKVEIKRP